MKSKFLLFHITILLMVYLPANGQIIDDIKHLRGKTISAELDVEKTVYNDSLVDKLYLFLQTENTFNQPLTDIKYLGDLYSPDGEIRIITWNLSLKDGTHDYYAFIQKKPNTNGASSWYELTDKHKVIERPNYKSLKKDNWYGALYYSIIPFKHDKTTMYALLGWEGNSMYSNKKLIDCLSFTNNGEPLFGKSLFVDEKRTKRRVIFEYSKEAYLMLRYNEDHKQIIFNRLEPTKPELEGLYSFYRPTLTYDAFELKKGQWVKVLDIKPENNKSNQIYHDPRKAPKPPK